jgi:hypothetical protein
MSVPYIETGDYKLPGTPVENGRIILAVSRFESRVETGDPEEILRNAIGHEVMAELCIRERSILMAHPELIGSICRLGAEYWKMVKGGEL